MTRLGTKRIHLVRCRGGMIKHRALKLDHGNFSWASEGIAKKTRVLVVVYNASNNELVRTNTLVKNSIIQIDVTSFRSWYEQHYGVVLGKVAKAGAKTADSKGKDAGKAAPAKGKDTKDSKDAGKDTKAAPAKGKDTKAAPAKGKDSKDAGKTAAAPAKDAAAKDSKAAPAKKEAPRSNKDSKEKETSAVTTVSATKSASLKSKLAARRAAHPALDQALQDQFSSGRLYAAISSRPGQSGRCDGYILEGEELAFYLRKLKK